MTDTPQTFTLTSPTGEVIMTGSLDALMERLPDTAARTAAIATMHRVVAKAEQAEQEMYEARDFATRVINDANRIMNSMDAWVSQCEAEKRAKADEAEREEQRRIQAELDASPDPDDPYSFDLKERGAGDQDPEGIIPTPADPTGTVLTKEDAGLEGTTATRPTVEPENLGYPPAQRQVSQPIDISLNED
jgi:hypothetical protein